MSILDPISATPAGRTAARPHLTYLDGVRGLAAVYVMMHHAWMLCAEHWSGHGSAVARQILQRGHAAVDIFIVLSGFCLMLPVTASGGGMPGGWRRFFWRRARRILPPYFVALVVSTIIATTVLSKPTGNLWNRCIPVTGFGLLTHALLINELFRTTYLQINAVFWSVAVEWKIYFLFPVLVFCCRRFGAFWVAIVTVPISYGILIALRHTPINTDTGGISAQYVGLFALGILGEEIVFSRRTFFDQLRRRTPWMGVLIVMSFLGAVATKFLPDDAVIPLNDLVVGLWTITFLIYLAVGRPGILLRITRSSFVVFIGTFAYSLYLVHLPLLQLFWQYILQPRGAQASAGLAAMLLIACPLSMAAAYLFFLICERPFLSQRRRIIVDAEADSMIESERRVQ